MSRVFSTEGYDGPPAWWAARCQRAAARAPLCDEYGTPTDGPDDDDYDDDDGANDGDVEDEDGDDIEGGEE